MTQTIVFFDTETGGLRDHHPTIQIAAVAVQNWEEVGIFERKIAFQFERADREALALNSYSEEAWASALPENQVILDFDNFLRAHATVRLTSKYGKPYNVAQLAGHNVATFDCPRLQRQFASINQFLPARFQTLDTLQLALWKFLGASGCPENFQLGTLCAYFGIDAGEKHDALSDARSAMRLAQKLTAI